MSLSLKKKLWRQFWIGMALVVIYRNNINIGAYILNKHPHHHKIYCTGHWQIAMTPTFGLADKFDIQYIKNIHLNITLYVGVSRILSRWKWHENRLLNIEVKDCWFPSTSPISITFVPCTTTTTINCVWLCILGTEICFEQNVSACSTSTCSVCMSIIKGNLKNSPF